MQREKKDAARSYMFPKIGYREMSHSLQPFHIEGNISRRACPAEAIAIESHAMVRVFVVFYPINSW